LGKEEQQNRAIPELNMETGCSRRNIEIIERTYVIEI
jgi:hypothetical protein